MVMILVNDAGDGLVGIFHKAPCLSPCPPEWPILREFGRPPGTGRGITETAVKNQEQSFHARRR